jgi:hypothetical protein
MTMADISMPLNRQGMSRIVTISLMEKAMLDQTTKVASRQQITICVMTAAITGFRSFPLFLENMTAITQAKGFSDKNITL